MDKKGVWIPIELLRDNRLTSTEKVVMIAIHNIEMNSHEVSHCDASNEELSKFCHCSSRSVSEAVTKLISLNYITKLSFDGRTRIVKSNI